jgi:hypothetical protein
MVDFNPGWNPAAPQVHPPAPHIEAETLKRSHQQRSWRFFDLEENCAVVPKFSWGRLDVATIGAVQRAFRGIGLVARHKSLTGQRRD